MKDLPDNILFTDKKGNRLPLEDVIADGLDGGYETRIPELLELLKSSSPYHQLMSCIVLTSWGHPSGFETIISWASNPTAVPWANAPVTTDRIYGVDDAFENLADALKTSYWNDETAELRKMQRDAATSLLNIYSDHYFGRTLALALLRDPVWQSSRQSDIAHTIETSIQTIQIARKLGFDLALQASSLLLLLARANDEMTAQFAERFIALCPENERMLRELTLSLADASGQATLHTLDKLKRLGRQKVVSEVEKALGRRQGRE